jgi:hypothetical protein
MSKVVRIFSIITHQASDVKEAGPPTARSRAVSRKHPSIADGATPANCGSRENLSAAFDRIAATLKKLG